jgi:hypothetical protein
MIYDQSFVMYFLSVLMTSILGLRLHTYLQDFFSSRQASIVTLSMILHPLAIDAFLAPNVVSGSLAFYLFIESLIMLKKEQYKLAIAFVILATVCNFSYFLFPLYFFFTFRDHLKNYFVLPIIYSFLISFYFFKYLHLTFHNPFIFFSYFSLNVIAPFNLSVIDYSLYPLSNPRLDFTIALFLLFFWLQKSNPKSRTFWPMLFLPLLSLFCHQWVTPYRFWSAIIMTPSNFFCITFGLIMMMAIHLPKKFFSLYFVFSLALSIKWASVWFPYSRALEVSIENLPTNFQYKLEAKRILTWQYFAEKKVSKGEELLKILIKENSTDQILKNDLENLKDLLKK